MLCACCGVSHHRLSLMANKIISEPPRNSALQQLKQLFDATAAGHSHTLRACSSLWVSASSWWAATPASASGTTGWRLRSHGTTMTCGSSTSPCRSTSLSSSRSCRRRKTMVTSTGACGRMGSTPFWTPRRWACSLVARWRWAARGRVKRGRTLPACRTVSAQRCGSSRCSRAAAMPALRTAQRTRARHRVQQRRTWRTRRRLQFKLMQLMMLMMQPMLRTHRGVVMMLHHS